MRFHAITSLAALIVALHLASSLAYVRANGAQQPISRSPQPSVYQGIVLKVKGTLSVEDLLAAIRNRTPSIKIDEYDVFGADSVSVQRLSRQR